MQQSSATQSLHLSFWGLQRIVACSHSSSQCLLVSTVFGTVSSLHPSYFIFILVLYYSLRSRKHLLCSLLYFIYVSSVLQHAVHATHSLSPCSYELAVDLSVVYTADKHLMITVCLPHSGKCIGHCYSLQVCVS